MSIQAAIADMKLATAAQEQGQMDLAVGARTLLCEVYSYAATGGETFYLRVYGGEDHVLVLSRPWVSEFHGLRTSAVFFSEALEADRHIARKGDIYHSIKYLPKDHDFISGLLSCLPQSSELEEPEPGYTLDGTATVIRSYIGQTPVTLGFLSVEKLYKNIFSATQKQFLHNLNSYILQMFAPLRNL